jgi:hypothetical protein
MKAVRRNLWKTLSVFAGIATLLGLVACGGNDHDSPGSGSTTTGDPFVEAAPEVEPEGPSAKGKLSEDDQAAVERTARAYIDALDAHDAAGVCALFAPGAFDLSELPVNRGDCTGSLEASIGMRPKGGGPAWKHTVIQELNEVSVGDDRARVTATVTHDFTDRKYVSVEEDVIYLDRVGGRWMLAKPSGTLYRAVGYPEPPLRALTPP